MKHTHNHMGKTDEKEAFIMLKAIIFDMDGVLIDSEIVYIEWEKEFFRQYGIELSDEAYRKTLGHSDSDVEEALEKIWRAYGRKEDFKALREAYYDAPKFHDMDYSMILNDGVRETLAYLKKWEKSWRWPHHLPCRRSKRYWETAVLRNISRQL